MINLATQQVKAFFKLNNSWILRTAAWELIYTNQMSVIDICCSKYFPSSSTASLFVLVTTLSSNFKELMVKVELYNQSPLRVLKKPSSTIGNVEQRVEWEVAQPL